MPRRHNSAFTIIELLIAIVVIAILAVIIVVAFNGITRRAQVTDLNTTMAAISRAMESERVLNSEAYPVSIPGSVRVSSNIEAKYVSGDASAYCIEGVHKSDSNLKMFVSNTSTTPKYGTCTTGEDTTYNPYTSPRGESTGGSGSSGWSMVSAGS